MRTLDEIAEKYIALRAETENAKAACAKTKLARAENLGRFELGEPPLPVISEQEEAELEADYLRCEKTLSGLYSRMIGFVAEQRQASECRAAVLRTQIEKLDAASAEAAADLVGQLLAQIHNFGVETPRIQGSGSTAKNDLAVYLAGILQKINLDDVRKSFSENAQPRASDNEKLRQELWRIVTDGQQFETPKKLVDSRIREMRAKLEREKAETVGA